MFHIKLQETIATNYENIRLRPEQFIDYLLSRDVGFSTCNTLDVPYNASKGETLLYFSLL